MTPDRATRRKRRRIRLAIRRTSALAAAIAVFFAWGTIGAIETDAVSLVEGTVRTFGLLFIGTGFAFVGGAFRNPTERPANESQVGISRFQFRKKATRSQTAERSKIETAVGQRGVQYEIRSAPVCLDKQLPRRSRYAGTCWQKPSCRPCKAFLRNAFCP